MSTATIVVQGAVKPDGTLELDQKLQLPAGRVQVTIQPVSDPASQQEDWWQYLQRARAELEASKAGFRPHEEIEAEREDLRLGDERIEDLYEELARTRQRSERKGC